MFDTAKISFFNSVGLNQIASLSRYDIYLFNEDNKDIENVGGIKWDRTNEDEVDTLKVAILDMSYMKPEEFQIHLWLIVVQMLGLKVKYVRYNSFQHFQTSWFMRQADIYLLSRSSDLMSHQLLPFFDIEYAIYYKIKDFHLSPTFFIDGISNELWIYIFIGFFGIFIGFCVSALCIYKFYRKRNSIGFLFIYQANFWCTQDGARTDNDRYLSWKIQKLFGFFFSLIVMTAFTAKFIEMMSNRLYSQPFHNLEDFTKLRTHTLCVSPGIYPMTFLVKPNALLNNKNDYKREWQGILNEPVCKKLGQNTYKGVCEENNVAVVLPIHQYREDLTKCETVEIKNVFPKVQGTIMIANIFEVKQKLNLAYIKIKTSGVMKRVLASNDIIRDDKIHYGKHNSEKYEVWKYGVTFDHVKLIIYVYFGAIPFIFVILIAEILYKRFH